MRKISKILCLFIFILVLFSTTACSKDNTTNSYSNDNAADSTDITITNSYSKEKEIYKNIKLAASTCKSAMSDIYNTWRFGIYDADDCTTSNVILKLSLEVSLSYTEIYNYIQSDDCFYTTYNMINGISYLDIPAWQVNLWIVENCFKIRGDYEKCDSYINSAKIELRKLNSNTENFTRLKTYYDKTLSYIEFFKSLNCSFNQLKTNMQTYENDIRDCESSLSFFYD